MITHWLLAARLKTLPVSLSPVILGLFLTRDLPTFNSLIAVLTLLTALLIQLGTNFANDYFDYKKGADVDRVGPKRMTQSGAIAPSVMKRATFLTFFLALVLGLYLSYYGGIPILIIGILSIFFGFIYTAGPFALAYIGGAEFVSFIFFGPISVMGTVYLQQFSWDKLSFYLGAGLGLIATALLVVNNTRDIDTDKQVNKKTFAVRFGRLFSYFEYLLFVYLPVILLDYVTVDSTIQLLIMIGLIGIATLLLRQFRRANAEQFNKLLFYTSLYLITYTAACIYFSIQSTYLF